MNLRKFIVPVGFAVLVALSTTIFYLTQSIPHYIFEMETLAAITVAYVLRKK